jgi:hypothetical protein
VVFYFSSKDQENFLGGVTPLFLHRLKIQELENKQYLNCPVIDLKTILSSNTPPDQSHTCLWNILCTF